MKVHLQNRLLVLSLYLLLALSVFALFSPAAGHDFINFDDNVYVTDNPSVKSGMSLQNVKWALQTQHGGHWHPLTWLSHQLDCEVFGLNAGAMHFVNIVFHVLNALLLMALLQRLFKNPLLAFVCAMLFALHPLRLESVVWISERKDVLSLFWGLLALHAYLFWCQKPNWLRYSGLVLCFVLGLLAKPSLVCLPLLLMLLDFWPLDRLNKKSFGKIIFEKIPLLLLAGLFSLIVVLSQKKAGALGNFAGLSWAERFGDGWVHFWLYVFKTLWPFQLSIFYPRESYSVWEMLGAALGFAAISFFLIMQRKRFPVFCFVWMWFFISLLPILGWLPVGGQGIANRWTYLPHVGLVIAFCGALNVFSRKEPARIYLCFAVLLFLCALQLSFELAFWKNSESLFARAVSLNPKNFLAHNNLAIALEKKGDVSGAKRHFEHSARLHPGYSEALDNLGRMLAREKNYSGALFYFKKALEKNPHNIKARYNFALASYHSGDKSQALQEWLKVLEQDPTYSPVLTSLLFMASKNLEEVCAWQNTRRLEFQRALENPQAKFYPEKLRSALEVWKLCSPETNSK